MMKVINYKIHAPTVLDFLKVYLFEVLGIHIHSRTDTRIKEEAILRYGQGYDTKIESHTLPA